MTFLKSKTKPTDWPAGGAAAAALMNTATTITETVSRKGRPAKYDYAIARAVGLMGCQRTLRNHLLAGQVLILLSDHGGKQRFPYLMQMGDQPRTTVLVALAPFDDAHLLRLADEVEQLRREERCSARKLVSSLKLVLVADRGAR